MGNHQFHSVLQCPYCNGSFRRIEFKGASILKCRCYEYPLLSGIHIIIQRDDVRYSSSLIKRNRADDAIIFQLEVGFSLMRRAMNRLKKIRVPMLNSLKNKMIIMSKRSRAERIMSLLKAKDFLGLVRYLDAKKLGEYMKYRFFSESYLVGEQIILNNLPCLAGDAKDETCVIDHMCGAGHYTSLLGKVFGRRIFATDQSFLNLLIARHCFNPDTECICLDGNKPLPFKDDAVDFFFNSDSFHYLSSIEEQRLCVKEAKRILKDDGRIFFAHLHIKGGRNLGEGNAHSEQEYGGIFSGLNKMMIDENFVMKKLFGRKIDGRSVSVLGSNGKKCRFIIGDSLDLKKIDIPFKEDLRKALDMKKRIYDERP